MGTIVRIEVFASHETGAGTAEAIERAIDWFRRVESACNRFDPRSEIRELCSHPGREFPASALLFQAVRFALAVAEETDGVFDPTVGLEQEARGFDRDYRSGATVRSGIRPEGKSAYRDIELDESRSTITLRRPLLLDLGAVAKGMAIDMAARELAPFDDFVIDAGGDLYVGGHDPSGQEWEVGIRHPRLPDEVIEIVCATGCAVCTSGDYERPAGNPEEHHLLDPRTGHAGALSASATVIAESALVADALATAAFLLGPVAGIRLLETHGVEGIIFTPELERFATAGMRR